MHVHDDDQAGGPVYQFAFIVRNREYENVAYIDLYEYNPLLSWYPCYVQATMEEQLNGIL